MVKAFFANLTLVDRDFIPQGSYREVGFQKQQVVDIDIRRVVKEYQAQILEDAQGRRFVGEFPEGINSPIRYWCESPCRLLISISVIALQSN